MLGVGFAVGSLLAVPAFGVMAAAGVSQQMPLPGMAGSLITHHSSFGFTDTGASCEETQQVRDTDAAVVG